MFKMKKIKWKYYKNLGCIFRYVSIDNILDSYIKHQSYDPEKCMWYDDTASNYFDRYDVPIKNNIDLMKELLNGDIT